MRTRTLWLTVSLALLGVYFGYLAITYPKLPDRIPVHFNLHGEPDNWSQKSTFAIWYSVFVLSMNGLFLVFFPRLLRKIPDSLLNIPWKDYWFSTPERKEQAFEKTRVMLFITGAYVNLIVVGVYHSIVRAALQETEPQPRIVIHLVWIFLLTAVYVAALILYARPPRHEQG